MADWAVTFAQDEWKFYHPVRTIPVTKVYKVNLKNYMEGKVDKKTGKGKKYTKMLSFEWNWDEQDHWAYRHNKKNESWEVYRVYMDKDDRTEIRRELCEVDEVGYSPEAIRQRIIDRQLRVSQTWDKERTSVIGPRTPIATVYWSKEFDGKSIIALCMVKPKMSMNEIKQVIENEGGWVDEQLIVHATTKY